MLQISTSNYASDALEDAMRLAQTKAINSYTFSDCLNYLNYAWMDMYHRLIMIDDGFYSKTIRIVNKLTTLPPFMKNTIRIYAARSPVGSNRHIFRASGMNDLQSWDSYHISGFDLYCPAATNTTVWLNYVPTQPMIFFTAHNRDPKLYDYSTYSKPVDNLVLLSADYNLYTLSIGSDMYLLVHKGNGSVVDITTTILQHEPEWVPKRIICDFPYVFVTYKHSITNEYWSGFFKDIVRDSSFNEYNPFAFTGRNSQVEYIAAKWNDKTGMSVTVYDWNDMHDVSELVESGPGGETWEMVQRPRIKELGWTPDTALVYPCPEMYRLLVAMLADKFSSLNESQPMGVVKELTEAKYAFEAFCAKDKSAWVRIDNVNGPWLNDWIV